MTVMGSAIVALVVALATTVAIWITGLKLARSLRIRARDPSCACGYSLLGLPTNRCPECGRDVSTLPPPRARDRLALILFMPASLFPAWLAYEAGTRIAYLLTTGKDHLPPFTWQLEIPLQCAAVKALIVAIWFGCVMVLWYGSLPFLVRQAFRRRIVESRRREGRCVCCGYSLAGQAGGSICPECGGRSDSN